MRAWKSAMAVACVALGVGLLATANAQISPGGKGGPKAGPKPAGNTFALRVCNKSSEDLFVAVLWQVGPDTWKSARWAEFPRGKCGPVGNFPRDETYWYAEDGNNPGQVTYPGQDAQGCIGDQSRERTMTGAYSCMDDERVVGFHKITETAIRDGITLVD